MIRLSSPQNEMKPHYTAVVIGSGYGGGIAASRIARAGQSVCVLERGREIHPGEYPATLEQATTEFQIHSPDGHAGSHTALFDLHVGKDLSVFVGCGLGGTSLVNANVSLRAEPRVFDDPLWPPELRADLTTRLDRGYRRAEEMLKPTPYPEHFPPLAKLQAMEASANAIGEKFYRPPINVTFEDGINHVGVDQPACKLCGDCVSGCNYGSKNTTLMNYLPDAWNHGAEIFTEVPVASIERKDGRWVIHFQPIEADRGRFDAPAMFVTADIVVVAAGTLGSTEILLRSKQNGLPISDQIGHRLSGNGDVLAFGYNTDRPIHGIGWGNRPPGVLPNVGPCITGIIDAREKPDLATGMVIEEGSIPGAVGSLAPETFAEASRLVGVNLDSGRVAVSEEEKRQVESLLHGPHRGAIDNMQTFLVMSQDEGTGRLLLDKDRLDIEWPGVGTEANYVHANQRLDDATKALGGEFVKNPMWADRIHNKLISVHPLGGCPMGESAEQGVVNHKGQVFSGTTGSTVHEGLYVTDGSVMPRPLGVNPLLTISAVSERCCEIMAEDHGWTIDYSLPSRPRAGVATPKPGLQFTETMKGFISTPASTNVPGDYESAAAQGKSAGNTLEFTVTVSSNDVGAMLTDPAHTGVIDGTVTAPSLSKSPLSVLGGTFNLFEQVPEEADTRHMRYRMQLQSEEGKQFFFDGYKVVKQRSLLRVWHDTTTLFITIHEGGDPSGPVLARGILSILAADFARQMTTMKITNAQTEAERLKALSKFAGFFSGTVFDYYGGLAAPLVKSGPGSTPGQRRSLRTGEPEVHPFQTRDGVDLRLTRYRGGAKGPVILSHGLGVSSEIFSVDTIETNLLEYLYAAGYDVWLLDFRASILLPASRTEFTGDDIATNDYPAAVAKVREITGAPSVQMVAHCYGSSTFFMAMLAGLEGVRSAVASQVATHMKVLPATAVKCGLHVPGVLESLGVKSMTAQATTGENWSERLYDRMLSVYADFEAEGECDNATCHRITFLYGPLYEHDQLNERTHEALSEMFGVANTRDLEHLATTVRKGHLVAANGDERYMPHLDRLRIPFRFIHGEENRCFLPESTELTVDALRKENGDLYSRKVIPGYGHIDCIFGKNAANDVYPLILEHLEQTAAGGEAR